MIEMDYRLCHIIDKESTHSKVDAAEFRRL